MSLPLKLLFVPPCKTKGSAELGQFLVKSTVLPSLGIKLN